MFKIIYDDRIELYRVPVDHLQLAEIRQQIIEACSIAHHKRGGSDKIPKETDFLKNVSIIEASDGIYHYQYDFYEAPELVDLLDRIERGEVDKIKDLHRVKDLVLAEPVSVKDAVASWVDTYRGPKGRTFLEQLNRKVEFFTERNRDLEESRPPLRSSRDFLPQIENCFDFEMNSTVDVHQVSEKLRLVRETSLQWPVAENYARSLYSPNEAIQLVKRRSTRVLPVEKEKVDV